MPSALTNWRLNLLYSELAKLNLTRRPRRHWVDEHGIHCFEVYPVETSDIACAILYGDLTKDTVREMLHQNEWKLWRFVWQQRRKQSGQTRRSG